jgi:5-methyltetrahydropteroyltriglutamate--homocysteine methyltransferase
MREEYRAIVDAGLFLQLDDARLAVTYDRMVPPASFADYRNWVAMNVEAINHALQGIPEERVRYHVCGGSWPGPHVTDVPFKAIADLVLRVKAGTYLVEGANPRHEHEWQLWQEVKLPDDKILVPGVVSHCIHLVEHPELVAQRIERYAGVVGRERVIAGTDCGFGTSGAGDEVHPDVAWAKLRAMVEGAEIASKRLWGR